MSSKGESGGGFRNGYITRAVADVEKKFKMGLSPREQETFEAMLPKARTMAMRMRWSSENNVDAVARWRALELAREVVKYVEGPNHQDFKVLHCHFGDELHRQIDPHFRAHLARYAGEVTGQRVKVAPLDLLELTTARQFGSAVPVVTLGQMEVVATLRMPRDVMRGVDYIVYEAPQPTRAG